MQLVIAARSSSRGSPTGPRGAPCPAVVTGAWTFMIVAGPRPGCRPHFPGGRIDPGNVRWNRVQLASSANYTPVRRMTAGADPPALLLSGRRQRVHATPARLPPTLTRRKRPAPTPSAAAGFPPAEREPLSPCTDVDDRACGWT